MKTLGETAAKSNILDEADIPVIIVTYGRDRIGVVVAEFALPYLHADPGKLDFLLQQIRELILGMSPAAHGDKEAVQ
jgi:hypothetical protein